MPDTLCRGNLCRERAAGMYAVLPYAVAQGAVELPWALAQSIVYSCITYFMIYFELSAAKFFYYLLFSYLTLVYFTFYGESPAPCSCCSSCIWPQVLAAIAGLLPPCAPATLGTGLQGVEQRC
jgi:ABC-type multidrug transport system permease subunit